MKSSPTFATTVLVVEDERHIATLLEYDITRAIPGLLVEYAASVEEAREKLQETRRRNEPYAAVILDCRLPIRKNGGEEEPDFTLGPAALSESRDTLIFHVTAYGDDPLIRRNLAVEDSSPEPRRFYIPKEGDWMKMLIDRLIRSLHNRRIRLRLDALGSSEGEEYGRRVPRAGPPERCDRVHSIEAADLCADAARHWEMLTSHLQNDLKLAFGYWRDPEKGDHHLGVMEGDFGEDDSSHDTTKS